MRRLFAVLACLALGDARACDDQPGASALARDSVIVEEPSLRPALPMWDRTPVDLRHRLTPWQRVLNGIRNEIEEINEGAARRKAAREAGPKS